MLCLAARDAAGQGRQFLHVDTDNGDDSGNGSLAQPYQRLNTALQRAYELRYLQPVDPTQPPAANDVDVIIKVKAATRPVAPVGFGGLSPGVDDGLENEGWQSFADQFLGVTHPPFPIRMINRVSIQGIRSGGQRPRITIDEDGGARDFSDSDPGWDGLPVPKRAYVHAANNASLTELFLDGTVFEDKESDRVVGVYGNDVVGFLVSNCRIEDLYDGMHLHADAVDDELVASVVDSELLDAGPKSFPPDPLDEDQGHAGAWIVGSGTVDVSFDGCLFEDSHDGVEVAGSNMTSGSVRLTACTFRHNENGAEVVGTGTLETVITDCTFDTNVNQPGGMPLFLPDGTPNSPGAIAARTMTNTLTLRESTFFNNAFHIFISSNGTYDLGRNGLLMPGMNTFDYDFSLFAPPDPARVALYVKNPAALVMAGGNVWYHVNGNQGTTPQGCLTGTVTGDPVNGTNLFDFPLVGGGVAREPPGPGSGMCCEPGTNQDWKRNFALQPNAQIQFGTTCLP